MKALPQPMVFARSPVIGRGECWRGLLSRCALALAAVVMLAASPTPAQAQTTVYWDTTSGTAGAGGATPSGVWNTANGAANRRWNLTADGSSSTSKWTSGNDAVFSAGTDATGAYTVSVTGTQNASSITVEEGSPTLGSGVINFSDATPDIFVAAGSTLTFSNAPTSSTGNLNIGSSSFTGITTFASDVSLAGTVTLGGGTLSLGGSSYTFGTLSVTGNSIIDFGGATTLNLTNLDIASGVTLTGLNWAAASDYFFTANWSGATQDLPDNSNAAPMNQVVFSNSTPSQTGWDSWDSQIRPNVPEPSTYGAILVASTTALLAGRRWRQKRQKGVSTP